MQYDTENIECQNPTEQERATWHIEHKINCSCREPSEKEKALIEK